MDPNQINQNPVGAPVDPMAQMPVDQPQGGMPVADPGVQAPTEPVMPTPPAPTAEPVIPEVPEPTPAPVEPVAPVAEPVVPVTDPNQQSQGGDMGGGMPPAPTATV